MSDMTLTEGTLQYDESYEIYKQGVETGSIKDVRTAISKKVDINLPINGKHPIVAICCSGYWQILDLLLNNPSLDYDFSKLDSLLSIVARNLTKDTFNETVSNYKLCFERLLKDPRIDLNLTDYRGNAPLHYTVEFKCDELTKLLLERGAYIGLKNLKRKLPIDGIDSQILKDFFDSRMTSNYNNHIRICNDFEINLDYAFLIKKPIKNNIFSQNTDQFYPIEFISRSEQLKDLISHPLIRYLIWMKYQALSLLFVWNIFLFFMYLLTIAYIIFFNMKMDIKFYDQHKFLIFVTEYAAIFCIVVIAAHLVTQIPVVWNDFRINSYMIWRFLNEFCIMSLLITVFLLRRHQFLNLDDATAINIKKQATAICILLMAVDMNLLMITFPTFQKISVHFLMLQKIARQFINVLLFYMTFLFAFSLAFYVLDERTTNESVLTSFYRLGEVFIRIIGMMTGELNLTFDSSLIIYYVLILVFIFLITIVLMNLLNGLAVSDVHETRLKAKLIYLIYRLQLIVCYDKYFLRHFFLRKYIFKLLQCRQNLFFIRYLKLSLNQYVKAVTLFPNKGLTILTNISKPIEPDNVTELEWRLMNKKILNELVEHFANQMQDNVKVDRDDKLCNTMNEIIERLDRIELNQKAKATGAVLDENRDLY